ncbi:MAG: MBL fold metallo-hydrolase [Anaerolineaceae bacterium]|nr:MBL fold metallo-hydrolase [Anaerolineaceae bacterium]
MSKITFLGTASAVPNATHHNAHFILESGQRKVLVDCSGNVIVRLEEAGIDPLALTDVILTHFHPDHVSGLPLLLMDLWLMGRVQPLTLHGLKADLERARAMLDLFDWEKWTGCYPVEFNGLGNEENMPVITDEDLTIVASPVCHMIPAIGLRMTLPEGIVAYSTDTGPCDSIIRLAQDANVLIHEASGSMTGHTSAAEAGDVATQAGIETLVLIHYPPETDPLVLAAEAGEVFSGDVLVAEDLMALELG